MSEPYKDPQRLRELYHDEGLSLQQVGDKFGVEGSTIKYWIKKFGIERRSLQEGRKLFQSQKLPSYHQDGNGYMVWQTQYRKNRHQVFVHRLLAVAEYGFDAVKSNQVHHVNKFKFDNRPSNIEIHSPSGHQAQHRENQKKGGETLLFTDEELLSYLEEWVEEHGELPTHEEFKQHEESPHPRTYYDRFGSWPKAKEALADYDTNDD